MVSGKTQAQRLFMSGKLKVKGDVMKVTHHRRAYTTTLRCELLIDRLGNEDGTYPQEGADAGKAVDNVAVTVS